MSTPSDRINLTDQFLISMPGMVDPMFSGSVVYMCDHNEHGALGLVIHKPTDLDLMTVFDKIDLKLEIAYLTHQPVLFGGPVQTERGFVLHEPLGATGGSMSGGVQTEDGVRASYISSLKVPGGLEMTTPKDVLEQVAAGTGPSRFLLMLGYAGWGVGQLEQEIANNGWLTVQADPAIVFEPPLEFRFNAALALLGVAPFMLSGEVGHA
ncbi:MAG: YqgE/AlgH family protein [Candidatus Protistobacter heckmanni]|nr:YqgE/AlgH family protein [Candidatus Protistobacter heckmanni]